MALRQCSNNHVVRDPDAKFCPECGARLTAPNSEKTPSGGPGIAPDSLDPEGDPHLRRYVFIGGVLLLLLICAVAAIVIRSPQSPPRTAQGASLARSGPTATRRPTMTITPGPSPTPRPTYTPRPTPTPLLWGHVCGYGGRAFDHLTDAQRDARYQAFVGKSIKNWQGWVYDVVTYEEEGFTKYIVEIANRPRGILFRTPTSNIKLYGVSGSIATALNKRDAVEFSGHIRIMHKSMFGDYCSPLEIDSTAIRVIEIPLDEFGFVIPTATPTRTPLTPRPREPTRTPRSTRTPTP